MPPPPNDPSLYPTPPGEQLGEPVSQYKPIALEVAQRSPAAQHPGDRDPTRDTYLGVVDDEVGMYGIDDPRTWVRPASEQAAVPITPTTPVGGAFGGPQQRADELGEYDLSRADPLAKPGPRTSARPRASRRTSAETAKLTSPAVKNKRRGMTAAALAELTAAAEREVRGGAAGLWTLPLGGVSLRTVSSILIVPCSPVVSCACRGSRLVDGASRSRAPHFLRPAIARQQESPFLGRVRLCSAPR